MLTIQHIITNHSIDAKKSHFPINTIRLLYLLFIYSLTDDNPQEKAQKMLEVIPTIGTILSKRTDFRIVAAERSINQEWQEVQPELQILKDTTGINLQVFTFLFSTILPSQEEMLLNIVKHSQDTERKLSQIDIMATLKLRSQDSLAYSAVVAHLINKPEHDLAIHYVTNLIYQLNDLLDSILFAKEDTENNNFSPFEVIRKSADNSTQAKVIIKVIIDTIKNDLSQITLPEQTNQLVQEFIQMLLSVLGEIEPPKEVTD
jgi:hypothetical protein